MHIISRLILALPFLVTTCGATSYTYWVDSSCSTKPGWSEIITEAFQMAKRAAERLESSTDTDFARVFKTIYSVDKSDSTLYDKCPAFVAQYKKTAGPSFQEKDTAYNYVLGKNFIWFQTNSTTLLILVAGILKSIGNDWMPVGDSGRLNSNIRFYCDEGAHFDQPRKKKPGEWIDKANRIKTKYKNFPTVSAMTSCRTLGITNGDAQNDERCTITIYDYAWSKTKEAGDHKTLGSIDPTEDLSGISVSVDTFYCLLSRAVLHELTHAFPYLLYDQPRGKAAYNWGNIVAKSTEDSVINSDNYAFLGLWAVLADRRPGNEGGGYTLARPWKNSESNEGKAAEASAIAGHITAYKDITDMVPKSGAKSLYATHLRNSSISSIRRQARYGRFPEYGYSASLQGTSY